MRKIINFIVDKRYIVLSVMLALTICMACFIPSVKINFDMTIYLGDNSNMKQGLDILKENFPAASQSQSLRIMFKDLDDNQKSSVKKDIQSVIDDMKKETENKNFGMVITDNSENFNKNGYTLFMVNTSAPYGSDEIKDLENRIRAKFEGKEMFLVSDDPNYEIPPWVMILAVVSVVVILFIMCASWFEPLLFLLVIGLAVLTNFGSNIILGTISSVTASIAAILQLALSIDYSIILMNRYRLERRHTEDKKVAMKNALYSSIISILSSSFTTIVGLLVLVLMNFKIGADLGIVLAKGVFISLLYVLTILPCLIILCDKPIMKTTKSTIKANFLAKRAQKTGKKSKLSFSNLKKRKSFATIMSNFTFKWKNIIMCVFIALFVALFFFQGTTPITFSLEEPDPIKNVFGTPNMVVLVHDSSEDNKQEIVADSIKQGKENSAVISYHEMLGKQLSRDQLKNEISGFIGSSDTIPQDAINMLYFMKNNGQVESIYAGDLYSHIYIMVKENGDLIGISPTFKENIDFLEKISDKSNLLIQKTVTEMTEFFGGAITEGQVNAIYVASGLKKKMSVQEFVTQAKKFAPDDLKGLLVTFDGLINNVINDVNLSEQDALNLFKGLDNSITENQVHLLYVSYFAKNNFDENWTMSLHGFIDYLVEQTGEGKPLAGFVDTQTKIALNIVKTTIEMVKGELTNEKYSILVITNNLPQEGKETTEFFDNIVDVCNKNFTGKYYMVGQSYMNYEMHNNFKKELNLITIVTVIVIFLVVALSFRNLIIPLILVCIVQCGVFLTVCSLHFSGVYFLALLIVECILMGATIDYGILFTTFYREHRKFTSVKKAIKNSYKHSIHTVLTSGSILVFATGLIGIFDRTTISQICLAISLGALSAVLLILFVLPSLLIVFDKLVMGKNKGDKTKKKHKKNKNNSVMIDEEVCKEDENSSTESDDNQSTSNYQKEENLPV